MKVLKVILAIILPPVAAFMQVKLTMHFWINLVLKNKPLRLTDKAEKPTL